jgi:hypothetical protein
VGPEGKQGLTGTIGPAGPEGKQGLTGAIGPAGPEEEAVAWSPSRHVNASTVPAKWFIMNSEEGEEMPIDQPIAMKSALEAIGFAPKYRILTGVVHAFAYWSRVESEVYAFIAAPS